MSKASGPYRWLGGALALLLTAGCVSVGPTLETCPKPETWLLVGPLMEGKVSRGYGASVDNEIQGLFWLRNPSPFELEPQFSVVDSETGSGENSIRYRAASEDGVGPGQIAFGEFAFFPTNSVNSEDPPRTAIADFHLSDADVEDCDGLQVVSHELALAKSAQGPIAEPGIGAHLRVAGFSAAGVNFFSNLEPPPPEGAFPKAEGAKREDVVRAYVYSNDPGEMPARYRESGYVAMSPEFNALVSGMMTTGARVGRIDDHNASNAPGAEFAQGLRQLVYYVELAEVREIPCRPIDGPLCAAGSLSPDPS